MARQVVRLADFRRKPQNNNLVMVCEGKVTSSSAENRMLFEEYGGEEDQRSLGQIL